MCEGARCGARAAIYGKMLCDEGYEHVYSLTFTEAELLEMEDGNGEKVPKGRAHRMVAAATAVLRSVGVFVGGRQGFHLKRRTLRSERQSTVVQGSGVQDWCLTWKRALG